MIGTNFIRALILGLCSAPFAAFTAQASSFTPGNLVVVRVGDGSAALSSAATVLFLDEYTPAGAFVQTIALPAAGVDVITNSGSATSEGFLSLSVDGQYLIEVGYRALPGTASVATTTSAANPRVVARIDLTGAIDTTTALTDAYSGGNIRSGTSDNGTQFWTAGTAAASGSVRYVSSLGATTSVQLSTTITNTRVVHISGNQLYVSSATGTFQGVSTVGTGLPTTSGQTITLLPGFPVAAGPSSYDFFFADANTLYVADDRTNGSGGIQKWTLSAGTWTLQYTLSPGATTGCRGLTGTVRAGVATMYATTTASNANQIVTVVDTGAGSLFTTVATAATNTAFRGLRSILGNPGINLCRPTLADGTPEDGWVCPCNAPPTNQPTTAGAGCNGLSPGSVPTGGALMTSSGTASLLGDTVSITVVGLPTSANESAYLLSGTTYGAPLLFGQGLRCCGGTLKRLQIHSPVPGTSTWPAPGDFSPTISGRHAMLGDTIMAGQTRCYFIQYRQTLAFGGCTAPPENFNASQAQTILWGP